VILTLTVISERQWLLEFIAAQNHSINASGIGRQHYDLYIDVDLLLETHLKPHDGVFVPKCNFHCTDCLPGKKGDIPHNHVDLCYLFNMPT
jgi:hypothetical protein